jgi:hypothetical protein
MVALLLIKRNEKKEKNGPDATNPFISPSNLKLNKIRLFKSGVRDGLIAQSTINWLNFG